MLNILPLQKEQLALLFKYSQLQMWHLEKLHVKCQYKIYPDDFFVAYKQNELVGFILAIRHTPSFGFISNFIILEKFRGRGFGKELFRYALAHLGQRQIALDSIQGKEQFYNNFGFKSYFDIHVVKFIVGSVTLPSSHIPTINFQSRLSLSNLDAHMQCIVTDKGIHYKAIKKNNTITSYALSFVYIDGYKIVLNSQDINEALTLFFELIKDLDDNTSIYMQVSKQDPLSDAIKELLNMKTEIRYTRMYNKIID